MFGEWVAGFVEQVKHPHPARIPPDPALIGIIAIAGDDGAILPHLGEATLTIIDIVKAVPIPALKFDIVCPIMATRRISVPVSSLISCS